MSSWIAECLERQCDWDRLCEREDTAQMLELLHACAKHPEALRLRKQGFDPERFLRENADVYNHYKRAL